MSSLYDEAIKSISKIDLNSFALTMKESALIMENFEDNIPILSYGVGAINWAKLDNVGRVFTSKELLSKITAEDTVYIIWNDNELPLIQTNVGAVLKNTEDICAVSFDTWVFNLTKRFVIELVNEKAFKFSFY